MAIELNNRRQWSEKEKSSANHYGSMPSAFLSVLYIEEGTYGAIRTL